MTFKILRTGRKKTF